MRLLALAFTLLLAGCATAPRQAEPQLPAASNQEPRRLLGLTATDLIGHFGNPTFQVREGNSLKLQFRGLRCVLDAYLYPQDGGLRVTHVDARTPTGTDTDQAACISALELSS
jgi:hypothetical protein